MWDFEEQTGDYKFSRLIARKVKRVIFHNCLTFIENILKVLLMVYKEQHID